MPLLMCPNCNGSMQEIKRADVAFDMCPNCRGVWLDRGELEKIIAAAKEDRTAIEQERAGYQAQSQQQQRPAYGQGERREYRGDDDRRDYDHRRKKRGFDLFDIFD